MEILVIVKVTKPRFPYPERYRWIQPHTTFDYIAPKDPKMYDLRFRVVRFRISGGCYETVYTNLDSEKGFAFFQKFLKDSGILADLERAGIQEGDTVRMYGLQFDYYK